MAKQNAYQKFIAAQGAVAKPKDVKAGPLTVDYVAPPEPPVIEAVVEIDDVEVEVTETDSEIVVPEPPRYTGSRKRK